MSGEALRDSRRRPDRRADPAGTASRLASQAQFKLVRERLEAFPDIPIETADYERAALCFNQCRTHGIQGSNTGYLICALVLRLGLPMFSTDGDFSRYAKILRVRLHAVIA